jgi:hypothetical protein
MPLEILFQYNYRNNDDNQNVQNVPYPPQNVQKSSSMHPKSCLAGVPGADQTTLAFKVEQSKIPEFYSQKGKDNILFIWKIDDLA